MTRAVLFDAPGPPGPQGKPGTAGRPGADGGTSQTGALSGSASPGQALVTEGNSLVSATTGAVSGVLTHAGLALTAVNGIVTYQTSGPYPYDTKNLGTGVACAVGTDANGNPVRVTDAACVSGLKYLGVCDANGAIYVSPRNARFYDVTDFGAVGDSNGTHGNGTDSTAAIQAAFDAAGVSGGEVFIPAGKFRTTSTLSQSHNTTIEGVGRNSIIVGDHSGDVIKHEGPTNGSTAGNGVLSRFAVTSTTIILGTITAATNATPIQCTVAGHGLATGDFVNIVNGIGNTAVNGTWQVTAVDADNFTLNGSVGNGTYTANSGSAQQRSRIGVYEHACSFDTHYNLYVSSCFFGEVWDQSEVCQGIDSVLDGNLFAQQYIANDSTFSAGTTGGFSNVLTFSGYQLSGGLYGLVDDGGNNHTFYGYNLNGQTVKSIYMCGIDFGEFVGSDIESLGVLFGTYTLLGAQGVGACYMYFRHTTFSTPPDYCVSVNSLYLADFVDCEFSTSAATVVHNGGNADTMAFHRCTRFGKALFVDYTGYPTRGQFEATGGPDDVRILNDTAAPAAGSWSQGDRVWNTAPASGGYIGWVCVAGGVPGTWKGFGSIA